MLELYENIRRLRKEKKMSQEKLAELTGYSDRSSIAKIEKGEVDIPQSKIMLFAQALGVSAGELMGNDGIEVEVESSHDGVVERLMAYYEALNPANKENVLHYIEFLKAQEHPADDVDSNQET